MTSITQNCTEFPKFKKSDFKMTVSHETLDMKKFSDVEKRFIDPKAHATTSWKITWKTPKSGTLEEYALNYIRNQIVRYRCRIPVKCLVPDKEYNNYACQKSPLNDIHTEVTEAAKVIEPLNIGFDDVIRTILIDQNLQVGSIFEIDVSVPYDSLTRMYFRSKSIKPVGKSVKSSIPFDPNIHIGTIDIGGRYRGKFTVQYVDMNLFDSYQLYQFNIINTPTEQGIEIKTYDFSNVDAKYIIEACMKLADVRTKDTLKIWAEMCK